jgi:hypothetical protein
VRTRPRVSLFTLFTALPAAVAAMMVAGCASSGSPAATARAGSPSPSVVAKAPLRCNASVTSRHPADYTTVGIRVRTAPHARISITADFRHSTVTHGHRASRTGRQTIWYQIGAARLGHQVAVNITTSRHGRKGYCGTWFTPPRPPHVAVPSPPAPAPSPAPATSAASCYPISDEGTCYEPGEYCREDDYGTSGVAGDGEKITCEDNDGWRWEPA